MEENGVKYSTKSKTTAILLCVFLGCFGAQRFYLGYTGLGVLGLLTGGCCQILTLIDLIKLLTGKLQPADGEFAPKE